MPVKSAAASAAFNPNKNFVLVKVLLFAAAFILFLLSFLAFSAAGLTFTYFLDIGQLVSSESFFSIPLILFTVLTAISFALMGFFGFELETIYALIPFFFFLIAAFASIFFVPAYFPIFLALAIALSAAPIIASMSKDKPSFALSSKSIRMALFIFVICITIFSGIKTELNKDAYFDKFLVGAVNVGLTPVVQGAEGAGQGEIAQQVAQTITPQYVREQLGNNALYKTFYNFFSLFIAGIVFLTASAFAFVARWLSKPISFSLAKAFGYETKVKLI